MFLTLSKPRTAFPGPWAVPVLLVLSGAAGLGYQVIWVRLLSVGLGHETLSVLAVVTAFFAGLAVGGFLVNRLSARTRRPAQWYIGLEVLIGMWSLLLIPLFPIANRMMGDLIGPDPSAARHLFVTFLGPFVLLAPATIAMGTIIPFAERLHARLSDQTHSVGLLYGCNALGAALGGLAALVLLAPNFGFNAVLVGLAAINFLCAALVWRSLDLTAPFAGEVPRGNVRPDRALYTLLGLSGLLGIAVEVALVRGFAQTLEDTVYSFAVTVAVYLVGAAIGATAINGLRRPPPWWCLAGGVGLTTLWAAGALWGSRGAYTFLREAGLFGGVAEALVICAVFLPASIAMGAFFATLAQVARRPDGGLGAALGINLAGGALAPWLVGFVMVPVTGTVGAVIALGACYLLMALYLLPQARVLRLIAGLAASGATAAAMMFLPLTLVAPLPGERIVSHVEAAASTATVLGTVSGSNRLVVDGRFEMGGDTTEDMDRLQGQLPLLLHAEPTRALFLGLGTGATAAASAAHPELHATAIELSSAVMTSLPYFERPAEDLAAPRFVNKVGDARRYVRTSTQHYDVIVADTFHPARDGAALLYNVEHFESVRARLAAGGLFAQWIPLHQFDLPMMQTVVASFQKVFPDAQMHIANASLATPLVMLVGHEDGTPASVTDLMSRVQDDRLARKLAALGIDSPLVIMGGVLAGPKALSTFSANAPLTTDAFPSLMFAAPNTVYAPMTAPMDRLLQLVDLRAEAGEVLALTPSSVDATFAARLEAYWAARDAFLRFGAETELTGDPRKDALALAPRLFDILETSPDYTPALRPLIALGGTLSAVDPVAARALLEKTQELTDSPAITRMLARLPSER